MVGNSAQIAQRASKPVICFPLCRRLAIRQLRRKKVGGPPMGRGLKVREGPQCSRCRSTWINPLDAWVPRIGCTRLHVVVVRCRFSGCRNRNSGVHPWEASHHRASTGRVLHCGIQAGPRRATAGWNRTPSAALISCSRFWCWSSLLPSWWPSPSW